MVDAGWPVERRRVLRDALAIGLATGSYGVSFGALGVASGLSVVQTAALSVLVFTGASQIALVSVLAAGGGVLSGAAGALLLGVRNAFYAVRLAGLLQVRGIRRLVGAQLVIDESTAMALGRAAPGAARLAFWGTGLSVYLWWNLGTLVGAWGAHAVGDPAALGLDAAVPAALLALLWPRLVGAASRTVAVGAAVLAVLAVPVLPAGLPVLLAVPVALAVTLAGGRWGRSAAAGPAGPAG